MKFLLLLFAACFVSAPVSAQSWRNLLAERSLDHWQKQNGEDVASGWTIEDGGVLHLSGKGGNIVTRQEYGDFELWFEFRVAEKGNNGIKYRVKQYGNAWLGLEYQVLDDGAYPKLTREHLTGSLYDLVTPRAETTRLNAPGEFNTGKILVQNQRVRHWVNGQLMIDTALCGDGWKEHVAKSKFRDRADFGENPVGRIMLTDHNSEVWYRNVFIRSLDGRCCQ